MRFSSADNPGKEIVTRQKGDLCSELFLRSFHFPSVFKETVLNFVLEDFDLSNWFLLIYSVPRGPLMVYNGRRGRGTFFGRGQMVFAALFKQGRYKERTKRQFFD